MNEILLKEGKVIMEPKMVELLRILTVYWLNLRKNNLKHECNFIDTSKNHIKTETAVNFSNLLDGFKKTKTIEHSWSSETIFTESNV